MSKINILGSDSDRVSIRNACSYEQQFKDSVAIAVMPTLIQSRAQYHEDSSNAYSIAEYLWAERTKRYGQA